MRHGSVARNLGRGRAVNAAAPPPQPASIAELRLYVLQRFAALLEGQMRTQALSNAISQMVAGVQSDVMLNLRQTLAALEPIDMPEASRGPLLAGLEQALQRCRNLEAALPLLVQARQRRGADNRSDLLSILLRFDDTAQKLSGTLVQKDLLERQSAVLEQIILSHENVTQWKLFVQNILCSFQRIFPFQFFFIAFSEGHGLSLNLYYVGNPSAENKQLARERLTRQMLHELRLPSDSAVDIEEFEIEPMEPQKPIDDVEMITVAVPEIHNLNLAGLLGVAYASAHHPEPQEIAIIRSILAVMVMVVGSSKALGRTLSELEYYSTHDPLTGLHNRRYFGEMLDYEVGRSTRHRHEFSLLMLDLDDFKDVNDTWGHPCGDQVLRRIAECLLLETRKGDLTARLGGDEFILMLTETGAAGAQVAAEKLRERLKGISYTAPDGKGFHVTTSVGVVTFPHDADTVSDLMAGVDMGLYRAKAQGKDGVGTMQAVGAQVRHNRLTRDLVEKLRLALKEDRVRPFFQPIYSGSGELYAYETLARLHEPDGQTISAGAFIETIEKYGMGRELDRAVVGHALHALKQRMLAGKAPVKLFINLSVQELQGRGVVGYAEQLCAELQIPPSTLVFELLERDAIGDMTHTRSFLTTLREKGFLFALDDFGSGYNSFHYLRELSFDFVKIDGAFVSNILNSRIDHSLVRNLTHLCQDIGIQVVAEFVESEPLWQALRAMGMDYAQGYHLGVPTPHMP
ncbi:bifunctional diguanylate cyclase/phosphodiesterase [Serpentinimonas maccroryi]|nr:bifunctional diguanylate cyclase/phosphodiesterase [Serpentinimonas maccroryi]